MMFARPIDLSLRLILFCIVLAGAAIPSRAFAAPAGAPSSDVPPDLQEAIRSLKSTDSAVRQKAYDLISDKGDARLIAPLIAYRDGRLQDLNGRLIIYGESVDVGGKKGFPLLDAFTKQPLTNPDGSPQYLFKKSIDLSAPGMMRLPPAKRSERTIIADLVSTLSLLDPDPSTRIQSIRDTGERASKVFPDWDEASRLLTQLGDCGNALKSTLAAAPSPNDAALRDAIAAIVSAQSQHPKGLIAPAPDANSVQKVATSLQALRSALPTTPDSNAALGVQIDTCLGGARAYLAHLEAQHKSLDELPKYYAVLQKQLVKEPSGPFVPALTEAIAEMDVVLGDSSKQQAAAAKLGKISTQRAENELDKTVIAAQHLGDSQLLAVAEPALHKAQSYQSRVTFAQQTFAGLSLGSILVLLALGLSIVFGLMDVINMAHGEFMMIGAFTTFVVSEIFKGLPPGMYDYYPIVAIPAAFFVAGIIGYLCEGLIIRHLYGRPLETLLATFGLSVILIQIARVKFGDSLSVKPPSWMEGGWEVMPDLFLARNRLFIVIYCVICIVLVYLLVNRTKMGLLLRATTQNRQMAAALGVPTRRIDGLTFAFGCGLAGLAGVAVPLYNKINPSIGQEYIVDSFMVVVVGGVGTLAGAIWAGMGLGFLSKFIEPFLASFPTFASSSSVIGKVLVLAAIVVFLTRRPQGLFPPKGRLADA
jgi:urea transport system permease protein